MRAGDLAIKLLATGACALALYGAGTQALSNRALRAGAADTAYALRPDSSRAAAALAASHLQQADYPAARGFALEALRTGPARPEGGTLLALAAQQSGDSAMATAVMGQVGLLGWRHPAAQLWLLRAGMAQDNQAVAILRAEALLRQNHYAGEMLSLLRAVSQSPEGRALLVERLAARPGWRSRYLTSLGGLEEGGFRSHASLLAQLQETSAPPSARETAAFVNRLVRRGDYAGAHRAWRSASDPAQRGDTVFLPGDRARTAFDWQVGQVPGVQVTLAAESGEARLSGLSLEASGSGGGNVLEKLTLLAPGRYAFRSRADLGGSTPGDFARWRITCATGDTLLAGIPIEPTASGAAAAVEVPLVVPPSCPAQRVALWVDHGGAGTASVRVLGASIGPPEGAGTR